MSWHNKYCILATIIILTNCGFQPIYQKHNRIDLSSIQIETPNTLIAQHYKNALSTLLNPTSKKTPKKYTLNIELNHHHIALAIQEDRTITRYKIIAKAKYKLINIQTKQVISSGSLTSDGGYDKVESDYATYISQNDTTKRIIKELAENTRIQIMTTILNI